MTVQIETEATDPDRYLITSAESLKLKGKIVLVEKGGLPNDGLVIEDQRSYD